MLKVKVLIKQNDQDNMFQRARKILKGQLNIGAVIFDWGPVYPDHEINVMVRETPNDKKMRKIFQRINGRGARKLFNLRISEGPDKRGFRAGTFYVNCVKGPRGVEIALQRLNEALVAINETAELI